MAVEQSLTQAIMQAEIKATKADIMAIREAVDPGNNERLVHADPKSGGPALKQPSLDWKKDTNIRNCTTLK